MLLYSKYLKDYLLAFLNSSAFRFCFFVFTVSRLIIFFGFWYVDHTLPSSVTFMSNFVHWDSGWYLSVAREGYSSVADYTTQQNYAFFPLYPLLMKSLSYLTGFSLELSGVLLSHFFFFFALYYFHELLLQLGFGLEKSRLGVWLLAVSPANIYFVSIYTESLFLALSLMSMLFAYRKQWTKASLSGFFLAASRPNGVLILIPILLILIQKYRLMPQWKFSYLTLALIPFGLLGYMFYLHQHVGSYFAFKDIEAAWGRTGWHFKGFWQQFKVFTHFNNNILLLIITIILGGILYKNKLFIELTFIICMILPSIFSGLSESLARYTLTLFPFYIGLLCLLDNKKRVFLMLIFNTSIFILGLNICGWANANWLT